MAALLSVLEIPLLLGGVAAYLAGTLVIWYRLARRYTYEQFAVPPLIIAVLLFAATITLRWLYAGYGPFLTLFEVLLSNLFSLGFIYMLVFLYVPKIRSSAFVVLPVLLLLGVWTLNVPSQPSQLPATYQTVWLWVHVGVGKIFLGLCLVAAGLAGTLLLRRILTRVSGLGHLPDDAMLDAYAWRFMAIAFVFHGFMLIAGAVWAQDAWGRYWAWDSLETWAFLTWLAIGLSLHARLTYKLPLWSGWLMIIVIFLMAFVTFFGVPFSSMGPHKGIL